MPTVAELDVQINAKDDASATILALDALIKSLDGDDVDIDITANTAEVQAKISELLLRLRGLDTTVNLDLDAGSAQAELALLRTELDSMRNETVRVRVNDSELRRATGSMNEFRSSAIQASRSISAVAAGVIGLGTALIPIGAVAVGTVAALATGFTTLAGGVGLFALVAKTVFTDVTFALNEIKKNQDAYNRAVTDEQRDKALEKTKAVMDSLDVPTRTMVQGVLDFKSAWREFAMQFQPEIFMIAGEGLKGLAMLLPALAPIVQAVADAFLLLERQAIKALQGPFWQSFIEMVGQNIGPLLTDFVKILGNVVTGFAGIIMAFMPFTRDMSTGLVDLSRAFADWGKSLSTNKGFQDFVDYVRENMPLVGDLIKGLADAFLAIVKAGAPLGEVLLIIVTGVLNLFAAFQQANPHAATMGIILAGMLAVLLKIAGPLLIFLRLIGVLTSLALLLGAPILIAVAAVAALVGAFVYAYTHFQAFRDLVDTVIDKIIEFAGKVWDAIVTGLGNAADWLTTTFGPAVQAVIDFAVEQFDKIVAWANENGPLFQAAWDNIKTAVSVAMSYIVAFIQAGIIIISAIWSVFWPILLQVIIAVWTAIKGVISGALDIIMGIIVMWAAIIAGDWGALWDGIVQVLTGVWEIIKGLFMGGFLILAAIAMAFGAVLLALFQAIWTGISTGLSNAWGTIVDIFTAVWDALVGVVSAGAAAIQAVIDAFWAAVIAIFSAGIGLMVDGLLNAWDTIASGASAAWAGILAILAAAWAAIQAAAAAVWAVIGDTILQAWSNIQTNVANMVSQIQATISQAWSNLQTNTQNTWNSIRDFFVQIWQAIFVNTQATLNSILAFVQQIWSNIQTNTQNTWNSIQAFMAQIWSNIKTNVSNSIDDIRSAVIAGWNAIKAAITAAMEAIVSAIRNGMSNAKSAVSNGISEMVSTVTGAAGRFLSAGESLMSNLAQGILNGIGNAVGAVKNAVGQLTDLLPGSPAKKGPLSGQGYTRIRGMHFSEDLAAGIMGGSGLVARAAGDIADLMTLNLDSGAAFNAIANGTSGGGIGGGGTTISIAPGAIVLQVGDGVTASEARQAFDGAASSLAEELLTAIRRR